MLNNNDGQENQYSKDDTHELIANKSFSNQSIENEENIVFKRKQMIQSIHDDGTAFILKLRVLTSVHLEKDFSLWINPLGIIPAGQMKKYNQEDTGPSGYENGPKRNEFDGYTYFGSENIHDDDEFFNDKFGTTGG